MLTFAFIRAKLRSLYLGNDMAFQNRMMLRRTFRLVKNEVTGAWRKLQDEQLLTLHILSEYEIQDQMGGAHRTYGAEEK